MRAAPSPVVVRLSGIAVVLTLLLLRGFSPQFTLWVLPFIVLHSPNARGVLLASVLTANNLFVEGYLYVNLFADRPWLLGLTVAVRTVLLVGFGVALLEPLLPPVARVYRRLRPVALVVGVAAGLALLGLTAVRLAPVFVDRAVVSNPYADAVQPLAAISPDAVVVFTQTGVYDALAPYLAGQPRHLLANDTLIGRLGPGTVPRRLSEWLGSGALVVVEDEAKPRPQVSSVVAQWLAANAQVDDARRAGSVRIQTYRSRRLPVEPTMRAVFGDAIVLRGIAVEPLAARPGGTVRVTLVWEALQKMAQDYTVSVQLIGPDGRLVAQRDAMPLDNAYPTSIWHAGEMVPDAVKVSVPESAPPGEYSLILVLYDYVTLQRLPVGGVDHLALAPVTVW
ncbi:MAG: hypothetical protein HYY04_14420 [Chloroflexi bacterium]|nr:hypothetical protein [Chloroflexota bacterium]